MVYVVSVVVEQLRGSVAKLRYFFYWDGLINVKSFGGGKLLARRAVVRV